MQNSLNLLASPGSLSDNANSRHHLRSIKLEFLGVGLRSCVLINSPEDWELSPHGNSIRALEIGNAFQFMVELEDSRKAPHFFSNGHRFSCACLDTFPTLQPCSYQLDCCSSLSGWCAVCFLVQVWEPGPEVLDLVSGRADLDPDPAAEAELDGTYSQHFGTSLPDNTGFLSPCTAEPPAGASP